MQALETCYIRLCHQAELRTALNVMTPRHPCAPQPRPSASCDQCSSWAASCSPSSQPSGQHHSKSLQAHPSTPDLIFQLSPDPTVSSQASQPESASAAASTRAAEPSLIEVAARAAPHSPPKQFGLSQIDYCCFHSPFHKLVRKAFARLTHIDRLRRAFDQTTAAQMQARPIGSESPHQPHQHSNLQKSGNAKQDDMQGFHPQQTQSQPQQQASVKQSQATPDGLQSPKHSEQQQQATQHATRDQQGQQSSGHQSSGQLPLHIQPASAPANQASQLHEQQAVEAAQLHALLISTLSDRALERQLVQESTGDFEAKVQPGCLAGVELGNSYSGEHVADGYEVLEEGAAGYHVAS